MKAIEATFKNGQIVPDGPTDWPEGCRLRIEPLASTDIANGEEHRETPEQIEDWLRWYRSLEPLEFTGEEEADLATWRRRVEQHELANSEQRITGLFR
jgi:hypothetical protein